MTDQAIKEQRVAAKKEKLRQKRAMNRDRSPRILAMVTGMTQEKRGECLLVKYAGKEAMFWPASGRYLVGGHTKWGYGVFSLIRALGAPVPDVGNDVYAGRA